MSRNPSGGRSIEFPSGENEILPLRRAGQPRREKDALFYYCLGPSMSPTLKAGDYLAIFPYGDRPLRRGDVVLFRPPGEERLIAHRLVAVDSTGLKARGDNNDRQDPWPLLPENILGRVVRVERRGRFHTLRGGPAGELYGRVIRCLTMSRLALFRVFRPAYRWAARTGWLKRVLPFRPRTRVVAIRRPNGIELQLVAGRFVLGRRPAGSQQWHIKRPLKPFLDLARLP
jgi:signal peptidase I